MDFLDMKEEFNKEDYVWFRGITGVWQHWEKRVLNGEVVLIIEGSERQGYWGRIQSCADDYDRFDPTFHLELQKIVLYILILHGKI